MSPLTIQDINALINDVSYISEGRLTLCVLTLHSGFKVVGQSSAMFSDYFDAELGRKYAKDNAVDKLFELEAYRIVHNKMTAKE